MSTLTPQRKYSRRFFLSAGLATAAAALVGIDWWMDDPANLSQFDWQSYVGKWGMAEVHADGDVTVFSVNGVDISLGAQPLGTLPGGTFNINVGVTNPGQTELQGVGVVIKFCDPEPGHLLRCVGGGDCQSAGHTWASPLVTLPPGTFHQFTPVTTQIMPLAPVNSFQVTCSPPKGIIVINNGVETATNYGVGGRVFHGIYLPFMIKSD